MNRIPENRKSKMKAKTRRLKTPGANVTFPTSPMMICFIHSLARPPKTDMYDDVSELPFRAIFGTEKPECRRRDQKRKRRFKQPRIPSVRPMKAHV